MLLLGSSTTMTIEGITVFPDHADPNQFWYLPGPVSLARRRKDSKADLTFIKYKPSAVGGGVKGGGFVTFTVNLRLDDDLERRILSKLSSVSKGRPKLAAVPFDEGSVKCIALNLEGSGGTTAAAAKEGTFNAVEQILGASTPSLHGDNTAAFSLTLSQEGATILEKAFEEGTTPVGVIYELKYTGIRPALDVKITADFKRIYNHFSAGLNAQVYFVSLGIDAGFEKLVQEGAIKIEVTNFTGEDDLKEKENWAKDFFKEKLLSEWFQPTLTPGKLAGGIAKPESLDSVMKRGTQLRPPATPPPPPPSAPKTTGTAPAKKTLPPNPSKGTGKGDAPKGLQPQPVTPAQPGQSPTAGTGYPVATTNPPSLASAGLSYTPNPAAAASAISGSGGGGFPAAVALKLKFIKQEELKKVTLQYSSSEATQRTYAPQGFFGLLVSDLDRGHHFVEVDLDDPFFRVFQVLMEAPVDFPAIGLNSAHLSIDYGDPEDPEGHKHGDFVFDKDDTAEKKFEVFMNARYDTAYNYQVQYHFDPASGWEGETYSYDLPVKTTEDRTLLVNPFENIGFLNIKVFPNQIDDKVVKSTEVRLSYQGNGWSREKVFNVKANSEPQFWKLRLSNPQANAYSYHFIHHLEDGTTREIGPVETKASVVPVDDPFEGSLDIELVPLFDPGQIKMVFVDFEYEDPENNYERVERLKFTQDSVDSVKLHVSLMNPKKRNFKYRFTFVGTDNKMHRGSFIETEETLIGVSN